VLLGIVLVLLLGGPAPGAVGSCEDDEGSFVPADEWCAEKGTWTCQRRWAQGTLTNEERDACIETVRDTGPGSTWPADCTPPSRQKADACIGALMSVDRLDEDEASIIECRTETLCSGGRS
jgi:hypothetical protein